MKGHKKKMLLLTGLCLLSWIFLAPTCMSFRDTDEKQKKEFTESGVELRTATFETQGRHIHYAMTGSDSLPTIFFVHGSPGSWDVFAHYMQDSLLLKKFRMVSVDRPGFGYSDFGAAEHLAVQSSMISPLFNKIGNQRPMFLVGHSLGGPMVIKLAADNPGEFSGIVIISGSLDPGEEEPEKWRPWLFRTPLNWLVPGALRPANEELWYLKKDLVDLKKDFPAIQCPVYFIHGSSDDMVPPANVEYGKKLLVSAKSVETTMIPNANHFIPWTKYSEIRDILLKLY